MFCVAVTKRSKLTGPFSLILSLTIAALVVAFMLPLWIKDRRDGHVRSCLSNVKSLTLATRLYAEDHDMRLPPAYRWMDATYPYCRMNYHCPALTGDHEFGYAFNRAHDGALLLEESDSRLIYESSNLARNASEYVPLFPDPPRHEEGVAIGFMNSRVGWRR